MTRARLAYFSPLNPVQSGISDYSEDLLPWLARWADVDLFVDAYQPSSPALATLSIRNARGLRALPSPYDIAIYQMGNSPAHAYIYHTLVRSPGVVVLHEHVLHHLISWMSWDRGDARTYLNEFRYCYGPEGEALARRVILGQTNINFFDYPLSDHVIHSARGLIVHSEYVRQAVLRVRPDAPLQVVPMGIPLPAAATERRAAARQRLGLSPEALVIASFGHINPFKRLDAAMRAFRLLRQQCENAVYVLVGSVSPNYNIVQDLRLLGLDNSVRQVGYADAEAFQDYVAATDICVNLRHPSAGETSASVLRLMGAGLPVLVSRCGAFEELPDGTCIKVDTDESEAGLLLEYMCLLAGDANLRQRIGARARRYVAEHHSMEMAQRGYVDALRSWYPGVLPDEPEAMPMPIPIAKPLPHSPLPVVKGEGDGQAGGEYPASASSPEPGVLDVVAEAASDLGLGDDRVALQDMARAWVELGQPR